MVRITRRITESSTSTSTSYWHDADAGGSGSTYGDAALLSSPSSSSARRRENLARSERAAAARSFSGGVRGSGGSGSGSGAAAELWADALRAALLGGAASVGYHVTSVFTRMAMQYVEEWFRRRRRSCSNRLVAGSHEEDGEIDDGRRSCGRSSSGSRSRSSSIGVSDSHDAANGQLITMEHRIKSAMSRITTALQGGAWRLSRRVKIRLCELRRCAATAAGSGSAWPLVILIVAAWPPPMLCNNSTSNMKNDSLRHRHYMVLYPLVLLYILGGRDGDDDNGNDNDDDNDNHGDGSNDDGGGVGVRGSTIQSRGAPSLPPSSQSARSNPITSSDLNSNNNQNGDDHRIRSDFVATQTSTTGVGGGGGGEENGISTTINSKTPTRYLEMMIHNVSHTDLVLGIGGGGGGGGTARRKKRGVIDLVTPDPSSTPSDDAANVNDNASGDPVRTIDTDLQGHHHHHRLDQLDKYVLCRPRFSAFDLFTRRILDVVRSSLILSGSEALGDAVVSFPRYERSDATPRYDLVTPRVKNRERMLPVGFDLDDCAGRTSGDGDGDNDGDGDDPLTVRADEVPSLRVRGRDVFKMGPSYESAMRSHWVDVADPQRQQQQHEKQWNDDNSASKLNGVFFPLLATLLRRWHADIADKYDSALSSSGGGGGGGGRRSSVKKVLILVSGVGSPRNWTHSVAGNSTQACAELMEIFVKVLYPDVIVVRLHSETNIFRYDENISFSKQELLPCVNAYRDAHARGEPYPDEMQATATVIAARESFDPDWKQTFSVAISFADGSPARTHAIQASLRRWYRPTYYHFWQLKTFWHDSKLSDEDIEVHPFEEMETVPAMDVAKINDEEVKLVIDEMKAFRAHFLQTLDENRNDIRTFWLRKTKKPVLAVLLVSDPEDRGKPRLYRGTNMEVSMPTGSLCAERNVIGTALATNPGLKREDLRMVAVLAVPLSKDDPSKAGLRRKIPSPPPDLDLNVCAVIDDTSSGAAAAAAQGHASASDSSTGISFPEGKEFLSEVQRTLEDDQRRKQHQSSDLPRAYSSASFSSIIEEKDGSTSSKDDSSLSWTVTEVPKVVVEESSGSSKETTEKDEPAPRRPLAFHESIDFGRRASMSPPGTPMRKIKLNTSTLRPTWGGGGGSKKKRTVVVHSAEDINPLRPCGACNEWLKKIAESNPYFRVLTFTDADCNGVYVTPCQE